MGTVWGGRHRKLTGTSSGLPSGGRGFSRRHRLTLVQLEVKRLSRPRGHNLLGKHERRGHGMVRCVLRISPVGLASGPDLLGVNLDADREDFDLIDMAPVELSPPFMGPFPLQS